MINHAYLIIIIDVLMWDKEQQCYIPQKIPSKPVQIKSWSVIKCSYVVV